MKQTVLIILDGYGIRADEKCNAVKLAKTPTLNRLLSLPHAKLVASGREVGLPFGFMGNSEVGHLNIGAGRTVYQDMTKIDVAIEDNSINSNPILLDIIAKTKKANGRLHFMGLLSDAGVHSHINHLKALIELANSQNCPSIIHIFTDGRDTAPKSALGFVEDLMAFIQGKNCKIGSICGRFYAMDRDKRWERVAIAYNMLTNAEAELADDPIKTIQNAYAKGETDEFISPVIIGSKDNCIKDNDSVFMFNFRADRARQLAAIFAHTKIEDLKISKEVKLTALASMTLYDDKLTIPVAFEKDNLVDTLGEVISKLGEKQFRVAETEKYAHVTYFFNGGREEAFANEDRCLVNSPKDVKTYDQKPQMSAELVCDKLIEAYNKHIYSLIVCNFANPDMLGHTGNLTAAIQGIEVVDKCVEKIAKLVLNSGGRLAITSDHGNSELMCQEDGSPHTAHTTNLTPFVILEDDFDKPKAIELKEQGKLGDIAPTLLDLWGIKKPEIMTGLSLKNKRDA